MEWRHAAGLTSDRTDLIRRALEAAHQELVANNYLEQAGIEGRGKQAYAHYTFAERESADPALVLMLRQAGVTVSRATTLAAEHPEEVELALRFLAERKAASGGRIRNPGGLVADFLENPAKYQLSDAFLEPQRESVERQAALQQARQQALEAEEARLSDELMALEGRSPEEQWSLQKGTLQILLRKHLNAEQWAQLEELAQMGEVEAVSLARTLAAAKASPASFQEQVNQLKRRLNPLLPLSH